MAWFHDLVCEGEAPGRLACGGWLLAELLLLTGHEGYDLGPPTALNLEAETIGRALDAARALGARWQSVPGAAHLDAFLESARGAEIVVVPSSISVDRSSWLDEALAFYRPLGLFLDVRADELAAQLDECGVGEAFLPSEEAETLLLSLEPARSIELCASVGAGLANLADPVLEGLARACRGVTSFEVVDADWPQRDESGDFRLDIRLRVGGREIATMVYGYKLKYPRWDVLVDDVNAALAPTGQTLWPFSQGSFVALLTKATATRITALRGVSFSVGCF